MAYEDWVEWRLANGSYCHLCPLNGQRKVGCIGDPNAGPIVILEAPGEEEEAYNKKYQKYGVPIVGRSGWALRHKLLAPAGLVEIEHKEGQWPIVKKWNCFVMNRVMCRPPGNKINSAEGKQAKVCCSNSAIALLNHLQTMNSKRTLIPLGGTALDLVTGQATIGLYRGRVLSWKPSFSTPMNKDDATKLAFKSMKKTPAFKTTMKLLNALPKAQRKALAQREKAAAKMAKAQSKAMSKEIKRFEKLWSAVLKQQRKIWNHTKSA